MAHSVSHNLILQLNGNDLTLVTVKKDGVVDDLQFFPLVDALMLDSILAKFPEIYSEITLLICKKDFITVPESFYSENISDFFKLSYTINNGENIMLDESDYSIGIGYKLENSLVDLIKSKFPRIKLRHEASVILKKLFKEVNFKQPRILFSINQDNLIIFAINNGNLVLCNSYQAKTNDDIFYFVMLTVEQLNFLPGETELIILGEPPNRVQIFDLFKNYIQEINIWIEEYKMSSKLENSELLLHNFALQSVLCE